MSGEQPAKSAKIHVTLRPEAKALLDRLAHDSGFTWSQVLNASLLSYAAMRERGLVAASGELLDAKK